MYAPCHGRRTFLAAAGAFLLGLTAAGAAAPLRVGLLPIHSPRSLITLYQPLRTYLERALGRPVLLETATDFRSFYQQLAAGLYDLALAPPHMARLAQLELDWRPLAIYSALNRAYLIMSRVRPVHRVEALRGQRLAVFDPLALNVMLSLQWLRAQGLEAGRDFVLVETPGHASVAYAVINGDALLGVTAQQAVDLMPAELRERFELFAQMPTIPSLVWGAHPRLAGEIDRLREVLLAFADTPEGRQFFQSTPYGNLRALRPHELKSVEPYLAALRARLKGQP